MPRSASHCSIGAWVVWALFQSASWTKRPFSALVGKFAAPLRSAWSASTTKNSACCPLAVCSITHGAIFCAADGGLETAAPCWLAVRSSTRWPTASEEAKAATSATAADTKNNEHKIRRHDDGADVGRESGSLIIELPSGCG